MSEVLVTGAAGFLGSSLAKRLSSEGWTVHGTDVIARQDARRLEGVKLASYSWQSLHDLWKINVPFIIHCAAQADVPLGRNSPIYTLESNVIGTAKLCEAARQFDGFQRLICMSSESVYGLSTKIPIPEDEQLNPVSLYGASKAAQELVARTYWHTDKLPVVITRSSTLYGIGMRMTQVVSIFLKQAVMGEPITIHGDGKQTRDFNYATNLIDGLVLALNNPASNGEIFNLSGSNEISVNDIAEAAIKYTCSRSQIKHIEQREGEQGVRLVPDFAKAHKMLGYTPKVSFQEGMERTAQWMLDLLKPTAAAMPSRYV